MARERKTVKVADLIAKVNHLNRVSTCSPETRQGWNTLLGGMLHSIGRYAGFSYLTDKDVPAGEEPGIRFGGGGREFPDETRREYH